MSEEIKAKLLEFGIKDPKAAELANNLVGFDELKMLPRLTDENLKNAGFREGDISQFRDPENRGGLPFPGISYSPYS